MYVLSLWNSSDLKYKRTWVFSTASSPNYTAATTIRFAIYNFIQESFHDDFRIQKILLIIFVK